MSQQVVQKLSATKQKLSLGEVKKQEKATAANARKVIRTTVVNPDEIDWPLISETDEKELIASLSSDLERLRLPNSTVPLNVIVKISKGERRDYRRKWLAEQALEGGIDVASCKKIRKDVAIGVNCVSTALEQDTLCDVIIDKDVDPPMLTKLILPIARSKGIPIVAISGLSKTCKDVFKTRCIAIGFKNRCKDSDHHFYNIYSKVSTITITENESQMSLHVSGPGEDSKSPSSSVVVSSTSKVEKVSGDQTRKLGKKHGCISSGSFKPPKIRKV